MLILNQIEKTRLTCGPPGEGWFKKRGENTASAMETQLASLEKKIDDLLASVDDGNGNGNGPHRHGDAAAATDAGVGRSERHSS